MSKIQKTEYPRQIPISDWHKDVWDKSDYDRHEREFEVILQEYRSIKNQFPEPRLWLLKWLEQKNVVTIRKYDFAVKDNYKMYSNMFDRFTEWLSFREKIEASFRGITLPTLGEVIREMKAKSI